MDFGINDSYTYPQKNVDNSQTLTFSLHFVLFFFLNLLHKIKKNTVVTYLFSIGITQTKFDIKFKDSIVGYPFLLLFN
jgi:hypothetical protein